MSAKEYMEKVVDAIISASKEVEDPTIFIYRKDTNVGEPVLISDDGQGNKSYETDNAYNIPIYIVTSEDEIKISNSIWDDYEIFQSKGNDAEMYDKILDFLIGNIDFYINKYSLIEYDGEITRCFDIGVIQFKNSLQFLLK